MKLESVTALSLRPRVAAIIIEVVINQSQTSLHYKVCQCVGIFDQDCSISLNCLIQKVLKIMTHSHRYTVYEHNLDEL